MKNQATAAVCLAALMLTGCAEKAPDPAAEKPAVTAETVSPAPVITVPPATTAPPETTACTTVTTTAAPFIDLLENDTEKEYYQNIYETLSGGDTTVQIYGLKNNSLLHDIFMMMFEKVPEFFWLEKAYDISGKSYPADVDYHYLEGINLHKRRMMQDELDRRTAELLSQIPEHATDYEKVLFVHDYLTDNVEYDNETRNAEEYNLSHTVYGALVEGKAVCSGYASAFVYIMNLLGMDAGYCYGPTEEGQHAWNYIRLDGKYYWLDITWDDSRAANEPDFGRRYDYFLLNDDIFLQSHTNKENQFFVPVCDAMDCNYFCRNQAYLKEYSFEAICDVFAAHTDTGIVQIMFGNADELNAAVDDLFAKCRMSDVPYLLRGSPVSYSRNNNTNVLNILYPVDPETVT